ncbi:gamma carbonic anhydrase family protein [Dactylosporangium sp. NPDC049140]|uniref:gamma carbonic anhydrase family protein n=1 Tax=Dactylosporangium sp. NPDC049140 TaxID=3155647 RepID=UPI0033CE6CAB
MPAYSIEGVIPVVHPDAYVHPTAVLIGDVHIGAGCYVGPLASLRGDFGRIVMLDGSNLQDSCVFHTFPGTEAVLGRHGHVGHGAVLHGCRVGDGALVGMNAVVMDGAEVGAEAFVGAHAFVKAGFVVPPRTLAAGSPARIVRDLTPEELAWRANGTRVYQELAVRSRTSVREVEPLTEAEPDRPSLPTGTGTSVPLDVARSAGPPDAGVSPDAAGGSKPNKRLVE